RRSPARAPRCRTHAVRGAPPGTPRSRRPPPREAAPEARRQAAPTARPRRVRCSRESSLTPARVARLGHCHPRPAADKPLHYRLQSDEDHHLHAPKLPGPGRGGQFASAMPTGQLAGMSFTSRLSLVLIALPLAIATAAAQRPDSIAHLPEIGTTVVRS